MIQIGLQTELTVNESTFNRALLEAWPDVSERRRSRGFAYQRKLLWSALNEFGLNFFEATNAGPHYCGSLMFKPEPLEINGKEFMYAHCLCVGRDSAGSKSWFAKLGANAIETDIAAEAKKLYPLHFAFCAQPSSPIGQFAIRNAEARGETLPAYSDYFTDGSADENSVLISRVIN